MAHVWVWKRCRIYFTLLYFAINTKNGRVIFFNTIFLGNIAAENETNFEEEVIEFLVKEEEVNLSAKRGGE